MPSGMFPQKMVSVIVGMSASSPITVIAPPSIVAKLFVKMQLFNWALPKSIIAPPLSAVLFEKMQLVNVGMLLSLYIAPPLYITELSVNVQLVNVQSDQWILTAPPCSAELFLKIQLLKDAIEPELYKHPPSLSHHAMSPLSSKSNPTPKP